MEKMILPDGYRLLEEGEPMKADDLVYLYSQDPVTLRWSEEWQVFGECPEVDWPWSESYRPVARRIQ